MARRTLRLEHLGVVHTIEVERTEEGLNLYRDGLPVLYRTGPDSVRVNGHTWPCFVRRDGQKAEVWVGGRTFKFESCIDDGETAVQNRAGDVLAPMPGTILRVLVAPGELVSAQQTVLVMESMKMELSVGAPGAGRVTSIDCRAGELVDAQAVLITLEAVNDS